MSALSAEAQKAWDRAWEIAKEKHPRGVPIVLLEASGDGGERYGVEDHILEFIGPDWWNISCTCKAAEYGRVCHHRAFVARHRQANKGVHNFFGIERMCPWCYKRGEFTPAGYHAACEMEVLGADEDELRSSVGLSFHAGQIRSFYAGKGVTIPITPGKYDPLKDLFE